MKTDLIKTQVNVAIAVKGFLLKLKQESVPHSGDEETMYHN